MKKIISSILALTLVTSLLCSCGKKQEKQVNVEDPSYYEKFKGQDISINVYNWGEFISDGSNPDCIDINKAFEELTGIKVNYSTYATNEELYAKMKGGGADYDIIIPSEYMISRMIKEDMLAPLDFNGIPNFKNIKENFKNLIYDPDNKYSVPYFWGTVGIIYNTNLVDETDIDWDILWSEKYKDQILMFDNPRDAFAIAEIMQGYSLNTEDPTELKNSCEKLKEQKQYVQAWVMDEIFDKMGAEEAALAPYYAGDAKTLMADYDFLSFAIPKSGTNQFVDAMCIPKTSQNIEAAQMYINFMLEAEVAYSNTMFVGYSTPNEKAYEMLSDEIKNDGISYLPDDFLKSKTTVFRNLSDEANQMMQDMWTEVKSTNN